jgi:hypothetical protein
MAPTKQRMIVVDWSEVKHKYINVVRHGEKWTTTHVGYRMMEWHNHIYDDDDEYGKGWYGSTPKEMLEYLDNGYHAPEFAHAAEYVEIAERRVSAWNDEEGEADPGRLIGGFDDFYLGMSKKEKRPGLRVQIEYAFAAGMSSKTLQEYGAWVAGFLGALEATGYDLEVDIWTPLDDLYVGDRQVRSNVLMRVKRQNEVSDFTEWSAIFSPGGYRHLTFCAKCVAGDKIGKVATSSLGITVGGKSWGVEYDREDQTVRVTVNQRGWGGNEKFPKELLNDQAIKIGLLPNPIA